MAVDLGDLVDNLKASVNPPGQDLYPDATDDDWLTRLQNAFWSARMDGMLAAYTESDGSITPLSGTTDITRDLLQIVVLYASIDVAYNTLQNMRTQFRASAGNVSFEYQQSANAITQILKELSERRKIILTRLSDLGTVPAYAIDAVIARDMAMRYVDTWWIGY